MATAGFGMNNATYGRSRAGIAELKKEYVNCLNRTVSHLHGDKFNTLINVIRENWSGADADAFINDLNKQYETVHQKINTYRTKIESAFDASYNEFVSFQSRNKF